MKMSPVVHFEMGYEDGQRMADFYSKVFGWKTQMMGSQMGNYIVAQTDETDDKNMLKEPGRINGGFYQKTQDPTSQAPSVVIAVEDINEAMKNIEAQGGKILGVLDQNGNRVMEPQEIPGIGLWMSFQDTEGNRASILQPKGM